MAVDGLVLKHQVISIHDTVSVVILQHKSQKKWTSLKWTHMRSKIQLEEKNWPSRLSVNHHR